MNSLANISARVLASTEWYNAEHIANYNVHGMPWLCLEVAEGIRIHVQLWHIYLFVTVFSVYLSSVCQYIPI